VSIPTYNANIFHKIIDRTSTQPLLITCDNGLHYYVKVMENISGSRPLVNELVCAQIAKKLDLPIPEFALVNIGENFVRANADRIFDESGVRICPGIGYALKEVKHVIQLTHKKVLKPAVNIGTIPDILAFDLLIGNHDRYSNQGNLLFDTKAKILYIIDHGHVFELGAIWDESQLKRIIKEPLHIVIDPNGKHFLFFEEYIKGNSPFIRVISNIKKLTSSSILKTFKTIPPEWGLLASEEPVLVEYILRRRDNIEVLLDQLSANLPKWRKEH